MIAIVCGDSDGRASLVTTPENLQAHPALKEEDCSVELYCIRAQNWDEAMAVYYEVEGLGFYEPAADTIPVPPSIAQQF